MAGGIQVQSTWKGWRGPNGAFAGRAQAGLAVAITTMARGLLERVRREAPLAAPDSVPPGGRPGQLRAGLAVTQQTTLGGAGGTIALTSAAPYTGFVRRGRGPIVAGGRTLRFYAHGRWIYARRVAGVRPNDFVARAVEGAQPELHTTVRSFVQQIATEYFQP